MKFFETTIQFLLNCYLLEISFSDRLKVHKNIKRKHLVG